METAFWFVIWLALGCLVFYIAFRLLGKIFSADPASFRVAYIVLGVLALIALIAYCYYFFPIGGHGHQLYLKRN